MRPLRIPFSSRLRYADMRYLLFLMAVVVLGSCGHEVPPPAKPKFDEQNLKKDLQRANKIDRGREDDEINQTIARHQWTMSSTGSGLRYMYLKKGTGATAMTDMIAKINYKITLIDGTFCYSSDESGPKEVHIDHDNVETGLHEALKLMHVGDKMRFILPSHLAHGLLGDGSKIPPLASVIYEIELLSVH